MPTPVLIVKGAEGIGNRILALLSGILYSRISGRTLLVDWRDPTFSDDGKNAFSSLFDCPEAAPITKLSEALTTFVPPVWQGRLEKHHREMIRIHFSDRFRDPRSWSGIGIDPSRSNYQEDVAVFFSFFDRIQEMRGLFHGEFAFLRQMTNDEILRDLLREAIAPAQAVRERVAAFQKDHFTGPVIGIHVRRTDKHSRLGPTLKSLDRLRAKSPHASVFVATDNRDVIELIESRHGPVLTTPKRYSAPGVAIHKDTSRPSRVATGIEALIDLYLLAGCDYLIHDEHSSFARVARLITNAPRDRIHNVQRAPWLPYPWRHKLWISYRRFRYGLFR